MHYLSQLDNVSNNLTKTWKILNSIISRTQTRSNIYEIIINNNIIKDPTTIADSFNAFFANVGPNLAAKIPKPSQQFTAYLKDSLSESIFLKPADESEIKLIIHSLKNSHSKGQ